MPDPKDYTVGWVSAVWTEYVAAQAFLDDKHDLPDYVTPNDENMYTLGRVGRHNVVIGVLPDGEYGISAASIVAKSMLHSFPNIRIGLMVGIGGGAPTMKHDIRLGDVVVSVPSNGHSGVFHYDFGKTIQDKAFRTTGFLNQPPGLLRAAVADIRAQHECDGHTIRETIEAILDKKPRLRKRYSRPDPISDKLFHSRITHPPGEDVNCATHCNSDPSNEISRVIRAQEEDNPGIHYGTIASGNQLMKNAVIRDQLAAEKNVLCFEMEAAGLMNHFPCVIIRGICDYSDSHKNKEWQGYAAMTAAAYAKDLLSRIPQNRVENESKIGGIFSEVRDLGLRTEIGIRSMKSHLDRKEDLEVLNWLTSVDYGPRHSDILTRRQPGTGQWFLESPPYQRWINKKESLLFCPGIPGAGKTVLTSIIIEDIYNRFQNGTSTGIGYIYCNYRSQAEQTVEHLLSSLLKQLAMNLSSIPKTLQGLYDRHRQKRTRPLVYELATALKDTAALYENCFLVIDALDECQRTDGCCERFLQELFSLQSHSKVNLICTSRFIPEIRVNFEKCLRVDIHASDKDICTYIDGQMSTLPDCLSSSEVLQEEVKRRIVSTVRGMFLLAQLYLDSLKGKTTRKGIRKVLETLESWTDSYENAYRDAMGRINNQLPDCTQLANRILTWIVATKRPLTTTELQHALAVEECDTYFDEENIPPVTSMVSVCAGLVTVDEESNIIRLVHHTAQEYFEKTRNDWFEEADYVIAKTLVTYVSFDVFVSGRCFTDEDFGQRLLCYPLYDYAARYWGVHTRMALKACGLQEMVLDLLGTTGKLQAVAQATMVSPGSPGFSQMAPSQVTGLHLAAYFGLSDVVIQLLINKQSPDAMDTDKRTPLLLAATNGHNEIVSLLLASDITNVNSMDNHGRTAVSLAAEMGHKQVIKELLARQDLDVNREDEYRQTASSYAEINGHTDVLHMLSSTPRSGPVPIGDEMGPLLLMNATKDKNVSAVRSLLRHIRPDVIYEKGFTPFTLAAAAGYERIFQLMLSYKDLSPDSRDGYKKTALMHAAENGHMSIFESLLKTKRVDINSSDANHYTSLIYAAKNGHENICRLLLASLPVDYNAKDKGGQTALFWALENWRWSTAKLLLEHPMTSKLGPLGRNKSALCQEGEAKSIEALFQKRCQDDPEQKSGRTLLSYAAEEGDYAITNLLCEIGYNCKLNEPTGACPLIYAIHGGQLRIVRFLLEKGAKLQHNGSELHFAILGGHQELVEFFLERTSQADYTIVTGLTCLMTAVGHGRHKIAKFLLEKGAQLETIDSHGCSALFYAAKYGHAIATRLLVESGAQITARDNIGRGPLSYAARYGHKDVVELLLANGAGRDSQEYLSIHPEMTPLAAAAKYGHDATFQMLLKKGTETDNPLFWRVPLWLAAANNHGTIVQALLQTDNDGTTGDNEFGPSQFIATMDETANIIAITGRNSKYANRLSNQHSFKCGGQSALSVATERGNSQIVRMLIEKGACIESTDSKGRRPILIAVENGHVEILRMLIDAGACKTCADKEGRTPLWLAASKGWRHIVSLLL